MLTFTATNLIDLKAKIEAVKTLGLEIKSITGSGYFSDLTDSQVTEEKSNLLFCNSLNGTDYPYTDDLTSLESYDPITKIGNKWLQTESGLKVQFPRHPESRSYTSDAVVYITAQYKD